MVYLTALCGLSDRETVEPHPQAYRCFARISLLSACNRRGYIPLPPSLYRGLRTQLRAKETPSPQRAETALAICATRPFIVQHHPETKKEQRVQRTTPAAWVIEFGNYGWLYNRTKCTVHHWQNATPPSTVLLPNPLTNSATLWAVEFAQFPHKGLHFLANTGYTMSGDEYGNS